MAKTPAERMRDMRARQLAAVEQAPDAPPRDPAELLAPSVRTTIKALKLGERDAAAAQLALRYATAIDEAQNPASALRAFGPLLGKALDALKATPASRKSAAAAPERAAPNKIAQLRAAHAATKAKRERAAQH